MGASLDPLVAARGNRPKRGLRIAAALLLTVILALSIAPDEIKHPLHTRGHLHNAFHFVAFLAAACLMTLASSGWRNRLLRGCVALVFALTTEYMEATLYMQKIEWQDVGMDALGIVAGLITAFLLRRRIR